MASSVVVAREDATSDGIDRPSASLPKVITGGAEIKIEASWGEL
jgi:hypothetical protein